MAPAIVSAAEQAALREWAEAERGGGRLHANPRDPLTHSTPFLSADGGLTRLTGGGDAGGADRPVWVPEADPDALDPPPRVFWDVRRRVVELLGLHGLPEDHYKGAFLSYIDRGGAVPTHRDERVRLDGREYLVLRCNVLFLKPRAGGLPVIAGSELDIPERGMWAFFATELVHSAGRVEGPGARATLSFGFLVEPGQVRGPGGRANPREGVFSLLLPD